MIHVRTVYQRRERGHGTSLPMGAGFAMVMSQPARLFRLPCASEPLMNVNATASNSSLFDIASLKKKEAIAGGESPERAQHRTGGTVPSETEPTPPAGEAEGGGGVGANYSYTNRDLQHLMADWGVQGSAYDLNADGTVNVTDMLQMIGGIGTGDRPWSPETSTDRSKPPMNANTLAHIQIDFGQSGSRYDVTGDGLVNVSDILHVLSNWDDSAGAPPAGITTPDGTTVAPPTNEPVPTATVAPPTADLTTASNAPAPTAPPDAPVVATPETTPTLAPAKLKRLSAAMIERLMSAGYTERPPVNIREIVAKLNLEPTDRRAMMAKLREHYQNGLGVNLKA